VKFGLLVAAPLLACASAPPAAPPAGSATQPTSEASLLALEFRNGPAWLMKCDLAFAGQKQPPICGVDGIIDAQNPMLARTGAEAKARANLAKRIKTAVRAGLVAYQVKRMSSEQEIDEQYVEDTSREIAEMTLAGVKVYDTYRSPQGSVWVMVAMDVDSFRGQVQSLSRYDEGLRKEIVERAEDSFRALDDAVKGESGASHAGAVGPAQ